MKAKPVTKLKTAAVLTIYHPELMSPEGTKRIAQWLRRQAKELQLYSSLYSRRFTARYLYE